MLLLFLISRIKEFNGLSPWNCVVEKLLNDAKSLRKTKFN